MKTIILFTPSQYYQTTNSRSIPYSLLSIARAIDHHKYNIEIIDSDIEKNAFLRIKNNINKTICFAVSCILGPGQVEECLAVSKYIKTLKPDLPVIWGGWLPSTLPDLTIAEPVIDIIVIGQGERTFMELIDKIDGGESIENLSGIIYKNNGKIYYSKERGFEDLNNFPAYPYHLIDIKKYISNRSFRPVNYLSSVGCPHKCSFCSNKRIYKRRWSGFEPERVIADLKILIDENHANFILFDDANFFANKSRVINICNQMLKNRLTDKIKWAATVSPEILVTITTDFLEKLRNSGCRSLLIGIEAGSKELLKIFNKNADFSKIISMSKILALNEIQPYFFFINGFPGEPKDTLEDIVKLVYRILNVNPNAYFALNTYFPLPATDLFDSLVNNYGFRIPQSIDEWDTIANFSYNKGSRFFSRKYYYKANFICIVIKLYIFCQHVKTAYTINKYTNFFISLLQFWCQFRLKYRCYLFPFEYILIKKYKYFKVDLWR